MKKALMALSLLSVSLSQMTSANETQKPFPQNLYGGYWAMAKPVDEEYLVVNFYQKDGIEYSDNYRFSCKHGKYQLLDKETSKLILDGEGALLESDAGLRYANLTPMFFKPNEGVILKQTMTDEVPNLKERFPQGVLWVYFYSPTLKPEC